MTRRVTVKFDDDSEAIYEGVPDDVTPEEVEARAQSKYGKRVVNIAGVREEAKITSPTSRGGVRRTEQEPVGLVDMGLEAAEEYIGEGVPNLARGLIQGAGDLALGAGQLAAYPVDALAGTDYANQLGRFAQSEEEKYQRATPDSIMAGTGRVTSNVAGLLVPGNKVDTAMRGLSLADKVQRIVSAPRTARAIDLAARGAAQGLLSGAVTPGTSGEGATGKAEQLLVSATTGAVLNPVLTPVISGVIGGVKAIPKIGANIGTYFDNYMVKRQLDPADLETGLRVEAEIGAPLGPAGLTLTPLSAAKESAAAARPGAKHLFKESARKQAGALDSYIGKTLEDIGANKGGVEAAMNIVSGAIGKQVTAINSAMSKYGKEVYEPLYREKIHIEPLRLRMAAEDIINKYDGDFSVSGQAAKALAGKILSSLSAPTDRAVSVMAPAKGVFGEPVIAPMNLAMRQEGKESIAKILNLRRTASDATKGKFGIYEGVSDKGVQKYIGSKLLKAIDEDIDGSQIEGSLLKRIKEANSGYEELVRQKQKIQKGALSRLINADLIDTVDDLTEKVIAPEKLMAYITAAPPTKQKAIALALDKYDPGARAAVARGVLAKAKDAATNKDGKMNFKAFFEDIDKNKSSGLWLSGETKRRIKAAEEYYRRSSAEYGEHGLEVAGAGAKQARSPWSGTLMSLIDEALAKPVVLAKEKAGTQFYPRQPLTGAPSPKTEEAQNAFIRYLAQKQGEN